MKIRKDNIDLLGKADAFFERHRRFFLCFTFVASAVISFLLFDPKVNLSGDDSDYLIHAYNFAEHFVFPSFRGPLYPMVLSPFVKIFGMNLILLKALSFVFIFFSLFFLYKAFYKRIPASVLFPVLLLMGINAHLMYHSGQTYSEPMFLFLQSLLLYLFAEYFTGVGNTGQSDLRPDNLTGQQIGRYFIFASVIMALSLTRSIGYLAIGVAVLVFLAYKQYRDALYSAVAFVCCFQFYAFLKKMIWPGSGSAYTFDFYLAKDAYNQSQGNEDFFGILRRVYENMEGYISGDIPRFMGLIPDESKGTSLVWLAIILLLVGTGFYFACRKKNKTMVFSGLYISALCLGNFILLQSYWRQDRFILVFYPLILILIFYGMYVFLAGRKYQYLYFIPLVVVFAGTTIGTIYKTVQNVPILVQNIKGDGLYGYTLDWKNYILASRWAAKNIPADMNIAVRKPSISQIYADRPFYGIYRVPGIKYDVLKQEKIGKTRMYAVIQTGDSLDAELRKRIKYAVVGIHYVGKSQVESAVICEIPVDSRGSAEQQLSAKGLAYTMNFDEYLTKMKDAEDCTIYSPDMLLDMLRGNRVGCMILASLRKSIDDGKGPIVNTLHLYLDVVKTKYPDIVEKELYVVGDSEQAHIYLLNDDYR